MPHSRANGKICYIEIPAADAARSAAFYGGVFGWRIRRRGDGATAFDDPTGEAPGMTASISLFSGNIGQSSCWPRLAGGRCSTP